MKCLVRHATRPPIIQSRNGRNQQLKICVSMRTRLIMHCVTYKYHGRQYSVVINRVGPTMHYCELQLFHDAIVKACIESGKQCIAHTSKSGKTSALTGWNEFVKPYRDDSIFWHNIWKQCGSPRNAVWPMSCAGREKSITTL